MQIAHDVHGFVECMSTYYPKLDAALLPDRTSMGSVAWNADLPKIIRTAMLMAHSDSLLDMAHQDLSVRSVCQTWQVVMLQLIRTQSLRDLSMHCRTGRTCIPCFACTVARGQDYNSLRTGHRRILDVVSRQLGKCMYVHVAQ